MLRVVQTYKRSRRCNHHNAEPKSRHAGKCAKPLTTRGLRLNSAIHPLHLFLVFPFSWSPSKLAIRIPGEDAVVYSPMDEATRGQHLQPSQVSTCGETMLSVWQKSGSFRQNINHPAHSRGMLLARKTLCPPGFRSRVPLSL